MKYLLIAILFLTGCQADLGQIDLKPALSIDEKVDIEKSKIDTMQAQELLKTGRYKFEAKKECGEYKCITNWYKTPKGELGYIIEIWREDGEDKYLKVINNGPEKYRERDWELVEDKTL